MSTQLFHKFFFLTHESLNDSETKSTQHTHVCTSQMIHLNMTVHGKSEQRTRERHKFAEAGRACMLQVKFKNLFASPCGDSSSALHEMKKPTSVFGVFVISAHSVISARLFSSHLTQTNTFSLSLSSTAMVLLYVCTLHAFAAYHFMCL